MKKGGREVVILTVLVLAASIAATIASFKFVENRQRQQDYSSYSMNEKGFYGAFHLLSKTFPGKVRQEAAPLTALLKRNAIMVTARPEWSRDDRQKLRKWMDNGGILLNIRPSDAELGEYAPQRVAKIQAEWVGFNDIPRMTLFSGNVLKSAKNQSVIYQSAYGPEIVVKPMGKGRLILFSESLLNETLSKHPEAAAVFVKIVALYLRDRPVVVWDEGYGFSDFSSRRYGGPVPIQWFAVLGQLMFLAVLLVYTKGWRFGSPVPVESGEYISLKDYLHSLASFYYKAGARVLVLEELTLDLRRRLAKATGLSAGVGDERLVQAYQSLYHQNPQPLEQLLRDCRSAIEAQKVGDRELFHYGKLIDYFRRELDRYGIER